MTDDMKRLLTQLAALLEAHNASLMSSDLRSPIHVMVGLHESETFSAGGIDALDIRLLLENPDDH